MRSASLDLSRFIAAFIVLMGHFLFSDPLLAPYTTSVYLSVLHTGFQSVDYFFCLSGFVLTLKSINIVGWQWLKARLIRLMPIYWICWLVPVLVFLIFQPKLITGIGSFGLFLSAVGSQSLSLNHYLDGPNSPLWSLSVEIWLSVLLIPISRLKSLNNLGYLFVLLVILSNFSPAPIVRALPYFLMGVIAAKVVNNRPTLLISPSMKLICGFMVLAYWIVLPILSLDFSPYPFLKSSLHLLLTLVTLIYFYFFKVPASLSNLSDKLGKRSYVIYACHAPILFFYSQTISKYFSEFITPALVPPYLLLGIAVIALVTEILYRTVEIRAISAARLSLKRK